MDEHLEESICELAKIREVPQFLFCDSILPPHTIDFREKIYKYKSAGCRTDEIDFILESPGGKADDAYRIIRTLRNNFDIVNIIVPFWAKSAATLLSLGGSRIIMDEFAEFGPLDVQIPKEKEHSPDFERESALIDEFSIKEIETRSRELFQSIFINVYSNEKFPINKNELSEQVFDYLSKFYKPLLSQINPYRLGKRKRKLDIGSHYANRILSLYNPDMDQYHRKLLIDYLINDCPDHGYVVDYDLISLFLPNVSKSDIFGSQYEQTLSKVTTSFLDSQDETFIGFIGLENIEDLHNSEESLNDEKDRSNQSQDELTGVKHAESIKQTNGQEEE